MLSSLRRLFADSACQGPVCHDGIAAMLPQLGLRPLRKVLRVTKLAAPSPTVEAPVDPGAGAIDAAIPGAGFTVQGLEIRESATAEALAREQADFALGLIEPTAVEGRVVHGETSPKLARQAIRELSKVGD